MRNPHYTSLRSSRSTSVSAVAASISSPRPTRMPCSRMAPANLASCPTKPNAAFIRGRSAGARRVRHQLGERRVDGLAEIVFVLQQAAQRDAHYLRVEPVLAQTQQCLRPVDRLRDARELPQVAPAQGLDEARDRTREALVQPGHLAAQDAQLLLEARVLDVEVQAASPQRVADLPRAVRREHDVRDVRRRDGAEL